MGPMSASLAIGASPTGTSMTCTTLLVPSETVTVIATVSSSGVVAARMRCAVVGVYVNVAVLALNVTVPSAGADVSL